MKNLLYLSLVSVIFSACNLSMNEDIVDGMKTTESGLKCNSIFIDIEGEKVDRTTFVYGETITINCNNVRGFERKGGAAHVGMSIKVFNKDSKEVILENEDLFADNTAGFKLDPLLLMAKITTAFPNKKGDNYMVTIHIWDKDGQGVFDLEMPFTLEDSKLTQIESDKISYSAIYFWDATKEKTITADNVDYNTGVQLVLGGIEGLKEMILIDGKDGRVYPGLSIELIDNDGNVIISEENILKEETSFGVDPENLKQNFPINLTFGRKKPSNPLKLKAILFDQLTDEKLEVNSLLTVH